jgi:2-hydroxy-3-oxopropionate reductase
MAHIGFIGLGVMGKPMAGHLVKAGHRVYVYDRVAERVKALEEEGGVPCANARDVAAKSTIVFLMLPDTPDVEEVLFGKEGLSEGIKPGSTVIDMSSISPVSTRRFAERLRAMRVEMLDAPVSGGQGGAENATLSIMVGGKDAVFAEMKPYLETMGKNIVHIGANGDGQVCKVANQIVVASALAGVSEALVFASRAGADPAKVRKALLGGFAQSKILEIHGERMLKRNFTPGFRVCLHQKDLNIALQTAKELGVSLPATANAKELFDAVCAEGGADFDHSSIITALEKRAHHAVG